MKLTDSDLYTIGEIVCDRPPTSTNAKGYRLYSLRYNNHLLTVVNHPNFDKPIVFDEGRYD